MKPIVVKKGDPIPEGYESLIIDRRSKWGNPHKMTNSSDAERNRVIEAFRRDLHHGDKQHLLGFISELKGKALVCHCAPKKCHGDVLVEAYQKVHGGAYPSMSWAERIELGYNMPEPQCIFDQLVLTQEPTILYAATGTGKSVLDEIITFQACHPTLRLDGVQCDLKEPLRAVKIDAEQPHQAMRKYKSMLHEISKCDVVHVPIRAEGHKIDLDRILATCKEHAQDGYNFLTIDSLQRLSGGDLTKKAEAKRVISFCEELWSHFDQSVTDHHTPKMHGLKPYDGVAPMADSHILEDYTQGGLIWCGRAYRDPNVILFYQRKEKLAKPIFKGEQVLALRKIGFEAGPFPYEVITPHQSWEYWNTAPDPDEVLAQEIAGMSRKEGVKHIMEQGRCGKTRAYTLFDKLTDKYGNHE